MAGDPPPLAVRRAKLDAAALGEETVGLHFERRLVDVVANREGQAATDQGNRNKVFTRRLKAREVEHIDVLA